jgi:hypothetical protein
MGEVYGMWIIPIKLFFSRSCKQLLRNHPRKPLLHGRKKKWLWGTQDGHQDAGRQQSAMSPSPMELSLPTAPGMSLRCVTEPGTGGGTRERPEAGCQWLTPVIQATQEAEIRRITVRSQPGQIARETLSWNSSSQKKRAGWVAQGVGPEFKLQYWKKKKKRPE